MLRDWLTKNVETKKVEPANPTIIEEDSINPISYLKSIADSLRILVLNVKEDKQYRLKTKYNAVSPRVLTTTTADQVETFTEPVSSFSVSVPKFGSATVVYVSLDVPTVNGVGSQVFQLTPTVPSQNFGDLQVKNIHYASDVEGATFQIIAVRGL